MAACMSRSASLTLVVLKCRASSLEGWDRSSVRVRRVPSMTTKTAKAKQHRRTNEEELHRGAGSSDFRVGPLLHFSAITPPPNLNGVQH